MSDINGVAPLVSATGEADAAEKPTPRRRRRKPKAQFVLFRDAHSTIVLVPRATNAVVARFQDVLWRLEPALQARPNIASTAGWLLREGFRFATRNRVHGLDREPGVPTEDCVQLGIHIDRKTWADVQRWVVAENTTLGTVVPRLIELGVEQHALPAPSAGLPRRVP